MYALTLSFKVANPLQTSRSNRLLDPANDAVCHETYFTRALTTLGYNEHPPASEHTP